MGTVSMALPVTYCSDFGCGTSKLVSPTTSTQLPEGSEIRQSHRPTMVMSKGLEKCVCVGGGCGGAHKYMQRPEDNLSSHS